MASKTKIKKFINILTEKQRKNLLMELLTEEVVVYDVIEERVNCE